MINNWYKIIAKLKKKNQQNRKKKYSEKQYSKDKKKERESNRTYLWEFRSLMFYAGLPSCLWRGGGLVGVEVKIWTI